MQAALMYGPNDIRVEEIEKPKCHEGGFVLKVHGSWSVWI